MTSTTAEPLTLARDGLTLVRVSRDYLTSGEAWAHVFQRSDLSDDDLTFYASASTNMPGDWGMLVVPNDDPRSQDFWGLSGMDCEQRGITPGHRAWNIERRYLSPVVDSPDPDPVPAPTTGERLDYGSPVEVGERLVYDDGPGEGDVACTARPGDFATVVGAPGADLIDVTFDDGHQSRRSRSRFRRMPSQEHVTAPETAGETFTREQVDRMVDEARQAAKAEADAALEEFKEMANARAIEYAQSNGLCSEFERCMSDIGLMGRDEWREAHLTDYRVTFLVTMSVSASDEDEAEAEARSVLYNDLDYPQDQTIVHHCTEVA